jgi:transposase
MVKGRRLYYTLCMVGKKRSEPVFKDYNNAQLMLLPPSLDDLIESDHPVRMVDLVIEQISIEPVLDKYQGGGASSYNPRMLLKVLVYAYLCNIFSSRRIEASLKENIHFMWISGMNRPDHNTINRFRSERLANVLKEVFSSVVKLLVESGQVSLKEIYIDGTKIEANASRYSFVWGKAIKYNEKRISEQLKDLWNYTQKVAAEELEDDPDPDFDEIDPEKVKQTIERIDSALKNKSVDKKVKQKINYARKNWPKALARYDEQKEILGERNSFCKTDHDATFMRMKEDHMRNGQLKPGYNLQISTNNQFILSYSHHPNPTDTTTLVPHLEEFKRLYATMPDVVVADAGYGSEENYVSLDNLKVEAYIKYNTFDKEAKGKKRDCFSYDQASDCYVCSVGRLLRRVGAHQRKTRTGFVQDYVRYQSISCEGCSLREQCCRGECNRTLDVNRRLVSLKAKATEKLTSEKGIYYRRKRCIEVEPVFGNIKQNKGFRRFMLRGTVKTEIETGLLALAHNFAKMAA